MRACAKLNICLDRRTRPLLIPTNKTNAGRQATNKTYFTIFAHNIEISRPKAGNIKGVRCQYPSAPESKTRIISMIRRQTGKLTAAHTHIHKGLDFSLIRTCYTGDEGKLPIFIMHVPIINFLCPEIMIVEIKSQPYWTLIIVNLTIEGK